METKPVPTHSRGVDGRFQDDDTAVQLGILDINEGPNSSAWPTASTAPAGSSSTGVWSGFLELAYYLGEKPRDRWAGKVLDTRLYLFSRHGRALGAQEIAETTKDLRRLGPAADPGE